LVPRALLGGNYLGEKPFVGTNPLSNQWRSPKVGHSGNNCHRPKKDVRKVPKLGFLPRRQSIPKGPFGQGVYNSLLYPVTNIRFLEVKMEL